MADYLVRFLSKETGVRGLACVTTALVREVAERHQTNAVVTDELGRVMTGAALLGAMLKVGQRMALTFTTSSQKLMAESDSWGKVRGYPSGEMGLGHFDKLRAGRDGSLRVVKDIKLRDLITSVVPLVDGGIDANLTYYLNQSEQIPSQVKIDVQLDGSGASADADTGASADTGAVVAAGGVLIQIMPDGDEAAFETMAARLTALPSLASLIADGQTPETILSTVFEGWEAINLETRPLMFKCGCSWERSEKALIMLGRDTLQKLLVEGEAVVECQFCHEKYVFNEEVLETIIDKIA